LSTLKLLVAVVLELPAASTLSTRTVCAPSASVSVATA
jgi:hypothetical protein